MRFPGLPIYSYISILIFILTPIVLATLLHSRDLLTDITDTLPSNLQDDVFQGIHQNWWYGIPKDVDSVRKAFGVDDLNSLNAPEEFLNIP